MATQSDVLTIQINKIDRVVILNCIEDKINEGEDYFNQFGEYLCPPFHEKLKEIYNNLNKQFYNEFGNNSKV